MDFKANSIPKPVLQACQKLRTSGHKAWLAGGCVRDTIMNRKPRDWDIVTDAPMEKIRGLFPEHLEVGAAFGIIKLPPAGSKLEPVQIDIAIFRHEEGYSDHRHPDKVTIGNEKTDVERRDFTVNAMYFDPEASEVLDYVEGCKDIGSKTLRTVGKADVRFSEDALRILRAVRFSAQLGFKIEKTTAAALKKCGGLLKKISRERIREEILRLLESPRPIMGLEAIAQHGLWELVFGVRRVSLPADFRQLKFSWTPNALQWLCALGVTGLLGDPIKEPAAILERLTELLKLSNQEKKVLGRVLRVYEDSVNPQGSPLEWLELARQDKGVIDTLKPFIRRARGPTEEQKQEAIALVDQIIRWSARPNSEKSWPTAQTLMKEGFKAGPKLGEELRLRQWHAFRTQKPA